MNFLTFLGLELGSINIYSCQHDHNWEHLNNQNNNATIIINTLVILILSMDDYITFLGRWANRGFFNCMTL